MKLEEAASKLQDQFPIVQRTEFRGETTLELAVGPGVFVPRPETEQVAQFAIDALRAVPVETPIAVDLGTVNTLVRLWIARLLVWIAKTLKL